MSNDNMKPGFRKLVRTLRKQEEAKRKGTETTRVFQGVNIDQTIPGGRVRLVIGEITITTTTPKPKGKRGK